MLHRGCRLADRPISGDRRLLLNRRVRLLVAATISYNVVEAIVAITAGTIASSTALIGFGLDSVVEVGSARRRLAVLRRRPRDAGADRAAGDRLSFFALAAYVTVESVRALIGSARPSTPPSGIVLAAVSLVVMPLLSYAQRRAGRELGSASAVADSKQTLLCTYLSAVLLVGLVAQQPVRLVVGRPDRRTGHRRRRSQGRPRGLAGRRLLRAMRRLGWRPGRGVLSGRARHRW